MDLTPLQDYIVIEVQEAQKKTQSGILVQQQWKDLPPYGIIKGVGPKVEEKRLKPGVSVLYARYAAIQIDADLEKEDSGTRLIQEKHVLGILNKNA